MARPWRLFLPLVVLFSLISLIGVRVQAQPANVRVDSDLQMVSLGGVDGGGHVTWTFSGDAARELRRRLLLAYDSMPTFPRGFVWGNRATGGNGDQEIGVAEAGEFLDTLENQIETAWGANNFGSGTEFRYVFIDRSDRLAQGLPADRSSVGLVGSRANETRNLQISFIFNGRTSAPVGTFREPDRNLTEAVFAVFSLSAQENLQPTGCAGGCYPFPAIGGWRVVSPPASSQFGIANFLWMGNVGADPWNSTTGVYADNASRITHYSVDGGSPARVDLRFATSANFSFEHTGSTAARDVLLVQLSEDGTNWQDLTAVNDGDGNPAVDPVDTSMLARSAYDLNPWLGQRVFLRLTFQPMDDGVASGPGYYLRNLWINAPSSYIGRIDFHHTDYVIGFLSFQDFRSASVKPHVIRTPVGEVQFYHAGYNASALPADTARYATFDALENPQILFVGLIISIYLIGLFQSKVWEAYRRRQPPATRARTKKVKWLHWTGTVVDLVLVLFYFFPTAVAGNFLGGLGFWALAVIAIVGVVLFTWFWYDRVEKLRVAAAGVAADDAVTVVVPPPPPPEPTPASHCGQCGVEVEDIATAYACSCGQVYHLEHALSGTCGNCGLPLSSHPPAEKRMITVKCSACEEINILEESEDLAFAKCTNCHVILKEIPRGYNYLLIADEPNTAYEWFRSVVSKGVMGLCMSTTFPEKLRREYGLPDVELYWISDTNPGPRTLDPRRLDFEIMRALSNFVKANKGGAIVLDGLEYLIVENSFDRVLKFIKKVNDLASVQDVTMFVPITPTGLGPEEGTLLRKEFDKVETIGAPAK